MIRKTIFLIFIIYLIHSISCNRQPDKRKIQLSYDDIMVTDHSALSTTLHLEPSKQVSIAVLFFQNLTGDHNLEWLQKGLTEMFIRSLSQTRHLSVLGVDRLFEILERPGLSYKESGRDETMAALVAKEANVEAVLSGSILKEGGSLKILVKLHEPVQGHVLNEESAEGTGLETLFSMVDDLTYKIKKDMQLSLEDESFKGITDLSTNSLEAWRQYTMGLDLFNKFLIAESSELFKEAVRLDTTFTSAYLKLFECYMGLGEISLAQKILGKLKKLSYKATPHEKYQIDFYIAALDEDLEAMLTIYKKWLEQYPDDIEPITHMGVLYFGLRKYQDAIHYFKKVLSKDPKNKIVLNTLGYSYAYIGDFPHAIASLCQYKTLVSDEPNPYDSLGEIYLFMGDYREAEKWFKHALKVNENFTPSLEHLGDLYMETGEYHRALEYFQRHLEKVPDGNPKALAYRNIAQAYERLGEYPQAINHYHKSLDINVFQSITIDFLHHIYIKQEDSLNGIHVLEDYYRQMRDQLVSDQLKSTMYEHLLYLSLWYGIQIDESIGLVEELIEKAEGDVFKQQATFQLILLYSKKKCYEKMNQLWRIDSAKRLIYNFKEVQHISYSNKWKAFQLIKQAFYQNIEAGINHYLDLIEAAIEVESRSFEMGFRLFLADLYFYNNQIEEGRDQLKIVGMPGEDQWWVIGPFENVKGFSKTFPPEKRLVFDEDYGNRFRPVTWQRFNDGMSDGHINLKEMFKPSEWTVGYGLIYIKSDLTQKLQFRIGSNEAVKIWLNDIEIWKFNESRLAILDDNIIDVTLNQGLNKVLIKVCNRWRDWGFYFRVTDQEGIGGKYIKFIAADEVENIS